MMYFTRFHREDDTTTNTAKTPMTNATPATKPAANASSTPMHHLHFASVHDQFVAIHRHAMLPPVGIGPDHDRADMVRRSNDVARRPTTHRERPQKQRRCNSHTMTNA